MTTLTITSKGQVTLKQEVLRHLEVGPGDQVEVDLLPKGQVVISATKLQGSIQNLRGMFKDRVATPVTIAEMNQILGTEG